MISSRKYLDYNCWWVRKHVRGADNWYFDFDWVDEEHHDDWVTGPAAVEGTNEELHDHEGWREDVAYYNRIDEDVEEILYG
jgi:hypothetical protein